MAASPVRIGPFVGGMNTYSGPSAIADNEAVEIRNMDVDLDGSLTSRPGLAVATPPVSGPANIIGIYRSTTDVVYMIYAFPNAVYARNTVDVPVWNLISAGVFTSAVQYNDKLWLVQKPSLTAVGGGKWDPVNGYVAVAAMPRGYSAVIYKERMFISGSRNNDETSINRVKFSNPADPSLWTGTDTFDVNAGDGQDITKLFVYDGQIIIFKTDSTYVYAYETTPAKGQVVIVSSTIGANNALSVEEFENSLFVFHENKVYRVSNWNWEHANIKVPFEYVNASGTTIENGTSVSAIGNRLLCKFYDKYYILGLKTGAWTTWVFSGTRAPDRFMRNPNVDSAVGASKYYAGTYKAIAEAYDLTDIVNATSAGESFLTRLITKSYDFGPSYGFKRLFWWGVDLLAKTTINFKVSPTVYNTPTLWSQLIGVPGTSIQTWGRPLDVVLDVTDSSTMSNPSNYRTFVKLLKSLRFRQISFILESTVDGTTTTGPFRIFSLTAFVDAKQLVVEKVS